MNKKIALFLPSLAVGGAEVVMLNLARGFKKKGFQVELVLARAEGALLVDVPSDIRIIDLNARRMLFCLFSLIKYLRNSRPDILLSAMDHTNVIALLAASLARVPIRRIISVHTNISSYIKNSSCLKTKLTKYWIKPFYKYAHVVIVVSQGVANDLIQLIKLPSEKVKVIYNPIVTSEYLAKSSEPLIHPWFQPGEPPVIIGVGAFRPEKDFATLIRAFAVVRQKRVVRLMILGDGQERRNLEELISSLGITADVDLPGFIRNTIPYVREAALFVLSSKVEGLSTVLVEAMACGTAVVSIDCPSGPAEILENGRWGVLVKVGNVQSLADAILTQMDLQAPMGMIEYVNQRFDEETIISKYLSAMIGEEL